MSESIFWRKRFLKDYEKIHKIDICNVVWFDFTSLPESHFFGITPEEIIKNHTSQCPNCMREKDD